MRYATGTAVLAMAMLAGIGAAPAETVNGVTVLRGGPSAVQYGGTTVLRGTPIKPGSSESGIGSGSSAPPRNVPYGIDRSGAVNAAHTGSANAGGEIGNPPPGAGQ